jgi:hypothetical protein
MSESDHFLSRWSRRKQEAAKQAALPAQEEAADSSQRAKALAEPEPANLETPTTKSEPAFDLSKLPSLDSIGPQTDISVFMQPGVPASLSHAALRRAWSADPAIRDFVGLAENAWDFTAPDSIPGFGPLLPVDNVAEMVARHFGDQAAEFTDTAKARATSADVEETNPQTSEASSAQLQQAEESAQDVATNNEPNTNITHCETELPRRSIDIASQQNATSGESAAVPLRRRHGGAMPT